METSSNISVNLVDRLPPDLVDLVLQHLTGQEVLKATLVHRSWNDFITDSFVAWRNVRMRLDNNDGVRPYLKLLTNSRRRYQHIIAVSANSISHELMHIIENPRRRFRTIEIVRTNFSEAIQFSKILEASARFLEYLHLNNIEVTGKMDFSADFPKLETLRVVHYQSADNEPWMNQVFRATPRLKFLEIANGCDSKMKEIILASPQLKVLSLAGICQDITFFKDLSLAMPSRLEQFTFNDVMSSSADDENLSHFNDFFKSQSATLQKFETDALMELEEFETAFKMPHFETLVVRSFHDQRGVIEDYLRRLRLAGENDSLPPAKLKTIEVYYLNQYLLDLLALRASNLEEIIVKNRLEVINTSNWFPNLKKFSCLSVNSIYENILRSKRPDERSRLENLILEGIPAGRTGFAINVSDSFDDDDDTSDDYVDAR